MSTFPYEECCFSSYEPSFFFSSKHYMCTWSEGGFLKSNVCVAILITVPCNPPKPVFATLTSIRDYIKHKDISMLKIIEANQCNFEELQ